MKQIINGKLYNTETAKLIGGQGNGLGWNDFRNIDEDLYQKKTGEFFLAGEGGALTKYAEVTEHGSCAGSGIFPLTEDEARKWVEKYLDVDTYIELFGEPEE